MTAGYSIHPMPINVFSIRESYRAKMGKPQEDRVNVEKSMFKAHTFHFLLSAGKASLFPLLTIYFRLLGLTATEVGLVFAAQAFVRLWCAPMWTACAKACRKKKFVLMFSTFVLLASSLCLSLAPPSDFQNSPLYCKGPIAQLESEQGNKIAAQKDNSTSETVKPIENITVQPVATGSNEVQLDSTEDEVNKQVDEGREHEKGSTASQQQQRQQPQHPQEDRNHQQRQQLLPSLQPHLHQQLRDQLRQLSHHTDMVINIKNKKEMKCLNSLTNY